MKARHKKREEGGRAEWKEDLAPVESRTNNPKIKAEAEEKQKGGRAKRQAGGLVPSGSAPKATAARAGRKSGGRTGSNMNPLSSAANGSAPKGHSTEAVE